MRAAFSLGGADRLRRVLRWTFAWVALGISSPVSAQVITTVAGGGPIEGQATWADVALPSGMAVDGAANVYVTSGAQVLRFDRTTSAIRIVAGTGVLGSTGDGGPATSATLWYPDGLAASASGDVYIAAGSVRKVSASTGLITTVAGDGTSSYSGDGGPATSAGLDATDVALDEAGHLLYIADALNERVRRVDLTTGIITTVAGSGTAGYGGDGAAATAAQLNRPYSIDLDANGHLFIVDQLNHRVRRVDAVSGVITTFAGTGACDPFVDGALASATPMCEPRFVSVRRSTGEVIVGHEERIRRVDPGTGVVTTFAGTGTAGYSGDGGLATAAAFSSARDAKFDAAGDLLVADHGNNRLREIDGGSGIVTTVGGIGTAKAGRLATTVRLATGGLAVSPAGHVHVAEENYIRKVDAATGLVSDVIGNGACGTSGDGGQATLAQVCGASSLGFDAAGNLYFLGSSRVRRIDATTGVVTTVAGNGASGYGGDGGPATSASFDGSGMAVSAAGDVYIADDLNHRVRRVDHATGQIATYAGTGVPGFSGDGAAATGATLLFPAGVAVDAADNVFIADSANGRVRRVDAANGNITTVAGIGAYGSGPFGGQLPLDRLTAVADTAAIDEFIGFVEVVAVDANGNLLLVDDLSRVRKVNASDGLISTVAGVSVPGAYGDGGLATEATLSDVTDLAVHGANLFVATNVGYYDLRVRRVSSSGIGPLTWEAPGAGGSQVVTVGQAEGTTAWTAVSDAAWLTVGAPGGTGSGSVTLTATPNPNFTVRTATATIAGQVVLVTQLIDESSLSLEAQSLVFGAITTGAAFTSQTAAQTLRILQTGPGSVPWTATPSAAWLQVTPASGAGATSLSINVAYATGLPTSGTVTGTIAVTSNGDPVGTITVQLRLARSTSAAAPFGVIDTPTNNATGVVGAVPFTGWVLDDVEVTGVSICRAAVTGESAPVDARCANTAKIYVGNAVFIDDARPDVEAAYPAYPLNQRAGWGFMLLTNMLPDTTLHAATGGNGAFTFTFYATDRDGRRTTLGTRTITCANSASTLPFGTLDTPAQGAEVSGTGYANYGWVLTPQPKTIPVDGSTIDVYVDGVAVGNPDYGYPRSDIQSLFPGYNNTDTAVGVHTINTSLIANGLHTISWAVCDDAAACTGVGSRYFSVANGVPSDAARPASRVTRTSRASATMARAPATSAPVAAAAVSSLPADTWTVEARRGWDASAAFEPVSLSASGVAEVRGEEVDRLELRLAPGPGETVTGYLKVGAALRPLPVGASLDAATGAFSWAPGVGFVGRYDLVFVRTANGAAVGRRDVRVTLAPKGSGRVGAQVVIESPAVASVRAGSAVTLRGWAADLAATSGTGIDAIHVWAYPRTGAPVFLGAAQYGRARRDVAAVHGAAFQASGFVLALPALAPGRYTLAVFPLRSATRTFGRATTATLTVR